MNTSSNKINFTKDVLMSIKLPKQGSRTVYHDSKTIGLQLRVTSSGVKTFSYFRRIKNGSPERITLGRFPDLTIENARSKAATLNAAIAEGSNPADVIRSSKSEMTLEGLFNEYMERAGNLNKRPDKPKDIFRLHLFEIKGRKLSTIKHSEIDKLHKKIGTKTGKVTANIVLKLLHVMFNKAINEWRIWQGDNPAHGIKKFKEQSRDRFIQSDELPNFFKAVQEEENTTLRDYVLISLLTGARRSNVLEMNWDQVNFKRAEWRIPLTKNDTPQVITLSPEAIDILKERRKSKAESKFVFPGSGKSGHLVEPKSGWKRIKARAGIADLRIHDLRRTLGSWQARTGASLVIIGKSLNHKSPQSTSVYARLDLDPVRDAVNTATSAIMKAANSQPKNDKSNKKIKRNN